MSKVPVVSALLLILTGCLLGAVIERTGAVRKVAYKLYEQSCINSQEILDGVCGSAICLFDKESGQLQCFSERLLENVPINDQAN